MRDDILDLLKNNSKLSHEQIATMLDLSVEEVENEIVQLEKKNIIVKYSTLIDWDKTNKELVSALIDVKVTPERDFGFDAVAKRIYKFPEVSSVHLMSGGYDLSVQVEGRTMKEVALFVAEKLSTIEHVQSTATHFMLKTYKKDGVIFKGETKPAERLVVSP
ncbi:AsnC family transcriptional regulator [Orenia metallireducens]|jgi:DNA-binding Lrp family transcriptional regulator|uniref:Transcriptional regulator, AsnC family n=1 Tax=Orenia metallireducens TaxID=1413210 RepID=A0A285HP87_9FIRM|nr:Lrp/AsnC family transcriptional regulator [Orenia metallireducens]PRX27977.1 AsnC family transcriptional regulator [Orenia metallireducens]SNY37497.1 transcriptional regulator, AsnC family [Orenia metallireducens]